MWGPLLLSPTAHRMAAKIPAAAPRASPTSTLCPARAAELFVEVGAAVLLEGGRGAVDEALAELLDDDNAEDDEAIEEARLVATEDSDDAIEEATLTADVALEVATEATDDAREVATDAMELSVPGTPEGKIPDGLTNVVVDTA